MYKVELMGNCIVYYLIIIDNIYNNGFVKYRSKNFNNIVYCVYFFDGNVIM